MNLNYKCTLWPRDPTTGAQTSGKVYLSYMSGAGPGHSWRHRCRCRELGTAKYVWQKHSMEHWAAASGNELRPRQQGKPALRGKKWETGGGRHWKLTVKWYMEMGQGSTKYCHGRKKPQTQHHGASPPAWRQSLPTKATMCRKSPNWETYRAKDSLTRDWISTHSSSTILPHCSSSFESLAAFVKFSAASLNLSGVQETIPRLLEAGTLIPRHPGPLLASHCPSQVLSASGMALRIKYK